MNERGHSDWFVAGRGDLRGVPRGGEHRRGETRDGVRPHDARRAVIVFPISYIFGDILTEVYGYRAARRVIWLGFFANLLVVAAIWAAQMMPAAPFWGRAGRVRAHPRLHAAVARSVVRRLPRRRVRERHRPSRG